MRILLITILSILYLAASTGVSLNMHYCMGELAGTALAKPLDNEKCGKCGMEKEHGKDNGCCKDENKLLKAQEQNSGSKILISTGFDIISDLPEYYNNNLAISYAERYFNTNLPNGPPLIEISAYPIFRRVQHILI